MSKNSINITFEDNKPTSGTVDIPGKGRVDICFFSSEVERCFLGTLMAESPKFQSFRDLVSPNDLYIAEHQNLLSVIHSLAKSNKPFDVVSVCEQLDFEGKVEVSGGLDYIVETAKCSQPAKSFTDYANQIAAHAIQRKMLEALMKSIQLQQLSDIE